MWGNYFSKQEIAQKPGHCLRHVYHNMSFFLLRSIAVFILEDSLLGHCITLHDMDNCNLARTAAKSQGSVTEFHLLENGKWSPCPE